MSGAYYNENDLKKAAGLRELIKWGLIAPGEVDERSIEDVQPDDLKGFTQCHFFAGIGIWSYALRLARWSDTRPVWTGSCPCPSFSSAGKGEGFEDARHLWPSWYRLISKCRPTAIFGEQVEAAIGFGWIDLVQTDLEATAYAFGKIVLGACSVGAPHRRQRVYFIADSQDAHGRRELPEKGTGRGRAGLTGSSKDGKLYGDDAPCGCWDKDAWHRKYGMRPGEVCANAGRRPDSSGERIRTARLGSPDEATGGVQRTNGQREWLRFDTGEHVSTGNGINAKRSGLEGLAGDVREWRGPGWLDPITARSASEAGATRGFWADCDWWYGRDGKYRPIGAGLFPLAHGAAARVVRLSCYGDGIVAQVATAFIEAYISTQAESGSQPSL